MTGSPPIPPVTDELPIAVRAYAMPTWRPLPENAGKPKRRPNRPPPASEWTLIFDTETTTDPGQALRFGTYQLRKFGELEESGIFYDPEGLTEGELATVTAFAERERLALRSRMHFVDEVFFARAYQFRATIVGFNLPFDISRLAISHGSARSPRDSEPAAMRGGFTFKLSQQKIYPNIRIKHMSSKAALISFAAPMGQRDPRSQRNRGFTKGPRRGSFIDVKTLANALLAKSFSLASLSRFLSVPNPKLEFDGFDGPVSDEMLRYAVRDVQATWECYAALIERFDQLGLNRSAPEKIYSEAGIGKAYLKQMGIVPWRKLQPDVPPELLAKIMGSYFGGRSEVRIRREIRQVLLCDFLSMYPTVCTLMGLWRFVIADGMTWQDATAEARDLLNRTELETLQSPATWQRMTMLVRVQPDGDIFPVRASYVEGTQATIGANHLASDTPLWFTLADCIAAKLLTGKVPKVVEAFSFAPGPVQSDLRPIAIAGNADYSVDPVTTDFFKRVIELRQSIKRRMADISGDERVRLDTEQNALKIAANATSYGIWVEVNVDTRPSRKSTTVHSSTGELFEFSTDKAEMPGSYFHPLLATLITGAARLMLAMAESLAADHGLDWAFCDTDSMAFAKPEGMKNDDFVRHVKAIVESFSALNPYEFGGSILKIEDENRSLDNGELEALHCFAISSKRYALFNLAADGSPIMRKVSAHGLGHLLPPYGENDVPAGFPTPHHSVLRDGTARWHSDLWHQIVSAALAGRPDQVRRDYHPALNRPAISRYAATSPDMLRWFKTYNSGRAYRDQVKPFGFLLAMSAAFDPGRDIVAPATKGRPKKARPIKPIAPFDRDHSKAVASAFDREASKLVPASSLKTYAEALAQYHISPESKFLHGNFLDRGTTQRRHVRVAGVVHVGKEAHDWERQAVIGLMAESEISYGVSTGTLRQQLRELVTEFGERQAAKALGISKSALASLIADGLPIKAPLADQIMGRLPKAAEGCARERPNRAQEMIELREAVAQDGLRATARRLGIDPSNLRRRLH